jgi:hypothetical protein
MNSWRQGLLVVVVKDADEEDAFVDHDQREAME